MCAWHKIADYASSSLPCITRPANRNAGSRRELGLAENENIAICLAVGYPAITYVRSAPKRPADVAWR